MRSLLSAALAAAFMICSIEAGATTSSTPEAPSPQLPADMRTSLFGSSGARTEKASMATAGIAAAQPDVSTFDEEKPFHGLITRYAKEFGVPVSLAHAVVFLESSYRPNVRGRAGEIGLMQIKHSTARMMGYQGSVKELFKPEVNIKYGIKYLAVAYQLGGKQTCPTILKYNAGHGASRMNPISAAYCRKVEKLLVSN